MEQGGVSITMNKITATMPIKAAHVTGASPPCRRAEVPKISEISPIVTAAAAPDHANDEAQPSHCKQRQRAWYESGARVRRRPIVSPGSAAPAGSTSHPADSCQAGAEASCIKRSTMSSSTSAKNVPTTSSISLNPSAQKSTGW
jgi:hypothetical protein